MTLREAIVAHLTSRPAITALVGKRIHPGELPENSPVPAIAFSGVSRVGVENLEGPSGLVAIRFQFDCWAKRITQAEAVGDQLRLALDGFAGVMGGPGGVEVSPARLLDRRDLFNHALDLHGDSLDFEVWACEPTA